MDENLKEYSKMEKDLEYLQNEILACPKGSLRKRLINGKEYNYLQYREGKQVKSIYIKSDDVNALSAEIATRKVLEKRAQELTKRLTSYALMLGVHQKYRPVKNVDYKSYTLFMSEVAHSYKTLSMDSFIEKYTLSRYRGLNKRYLAGFFDYISGTDRKNIRRTNDLVLDPYTYLMYFKYGEKEVLKEELKKAIPAFLNRGLLITSVQEAVDGSYSE